MSPTGHCADRQLALLAAGPGTINTAAPGSPPTVVSQPSTREQQQQTILLFRTKYFYQPHKYFCLRHDGCEDRRVRPGHEQHQPGRRGELAEDAAGGPAAAGEAHPARDHPRGHPLHSDAAEQTENEGTSVTQTCLPKYAMNFTRKYLQFDNSCCR